MANPDPDRTHLRPPWPPGTSGNAGGRPRGVTYPAEYLRRLGGLTLAEVAAIAKDEGEPVNRRIAAKLLLASLDENLSPSDQERARAAVFDRTSGRPVQETIVHVDQAEDPRDVVARVREKLGIPEKPGSAEAAGDESFHGK